MKQDYDEKEKELATAAKTLEGAQKKLAGLEKRLDATQKAYEKEATLKGENDLRAAREAVVKQRTVVGEAQATHQSLAGAFDRMNLSPNDPAVLTKEMRDHPQTKKVIAAGEKFREALKDCCGRDKVAYNRCLALIRSAVATGAVSCRKAAK